MLKKRIIFTLLYCEGDFVLSRNFRLQRVGNIDWLKKNYNFKNTSFSIDELVILDVSRSNRELDKFCNVLKEISEECFVPIAVGGGIRSKEDARLLFRGGADKVVINTILHNQTDIVKELACEFGQQSLIASIDIRKSKSGEWNIYVENGTKLIPGVANLLIKRIFQLPVGEVYLNSIDRDGTGQGLNLNLINILPDNIEKPLILGGGIGNTEHIKQGLIDKNIDAVAIDHLFNFLGDGLLRARNSMLSYNLPLANWDSSLFKKLSLQNK